MIYLLPVGLWQRWGTLARYFLVGDIVLEVLFRSPGVHRVVFGFDD
jgi:hypothetical protein